MDANTVELLKECSKGCKMAIESMTQVLPKIESKDLETLVRKNLDEHTKLDEEIGKALGEIHKKEGEPGMMASTFSWISTEMKLTMDKEDKKIAKIMMDGCNMGIQSVSEYINKYEDADKESVKLAKELVDKEEKFMNDLKKYL